MTKYNTTQDNPPYNTRLHNQIQKIQYNLQSIQYKTMGNNTTLYNITPYHTQYTSILRNIEYNTLLYGLEYNATQYNTIRKNKLQYIIPHNTV